jgi:hypothetical protein
MKRGTGDAKGLRGSGGTRRIADKNCLKSSDTRRDRGARLTRVGHLECEREDKTRLGFRSES